MTDYESEYNNFLASTENGKKHLEESETIKAFKYQLEKEIINEELFIQKKEKEKLNKEQEFHFQLWSEGVIEDNELDEMFSNKK